MQVSTNFFYSEYLVCNVYISSNSHFFVQEGRSVKNSKKYQINLNNLQTVNVYYQNPKIKKWGQ